RQGAGLHGDGAVRGRVADGVDQEVGDHLVDPTVVGEREGRSSDLGEGDAPLAGEGGHRLQDGRRNAGEVDGGPVQLEVGGVSGGEGLEIGNEAGEAQDLLV